MRFNATYHQDRLYFNATINKNRLTNKRITMFTEAFKKFDEIVNNQLNQNKDE